MGTQVHDDREIVVIMPHAKLSRKRWKKLRSSMRKRDADNNTLGDLREEGDTLEEKIGYINKLWLDAWTLVGKKRRNRWASKTYFRPVNAMKMFWQTAMAKLWMLSFTLINVILNYHVRDIKIDWKHFFPAGTGQHRSVQLRENCFFGRRYQQRAPQENDSFVMLPSKF